MAKDINVDINVNNNIEGSIAQLKQLKRELKNTAVGTEEFKKLYNQIDDLEDKIKSAKGVSADWIDSLEMAGGPIGMLGGALNKAKVATQSWGAALKATGIGLVVAAVGMLVNAFSKSETSMKKLEPLFEALDKTMGGILEVAQPMIDMFIELAIKAMPYVTKALGMFYAALAGLFTYIQTMAGGIAKVWKGIFTLSWDTIVDGLNEMKSSFGKTADSYTSAMDRFDKGYANTTKKVKRASVERVKVQKKEAEETIDIISKQMLDELFLQEEHQKKLLELQKQYTSEIDELQADSEQKKLDLWYKRKAEEIDAIVQNELEKTNLYALLETERGIKQAEIEKKKEDDLKKIRTEAEDARTKYEAEQADERIRKEKLVAEAKKQLLMQSASILGEYSNILGQQTAEGKALAIAQATINAYLGISEIWKAPNPYPEPFGTATKIASTVLLGTSAFQNVQKILDVQVPGGGGGGGSAPGMTSTNAPQFNVVGTSGANQIAQTLGKEQPVVKAYVVSSDVTTQQALDRNIVKSATLG